MRFSKLWLVPALVGVGLLIAFLTAGPLVFPMDDAYIHSVYGRNLAETGRLTFNLNPPDAGVGTTSILWTLLLAAGSPLMGPVSTARLLGIASYLVVIGLVWVISGWLVRPERTRARAAITLLPALSGNLIWFSLSGMETMFWLALGLAAVVAYARRRWILVGTLLGLMTLTRAEGVVLLAAIWVVEVVVRRKIDRGLLVATGLMLVIWSPWLFWLHARTGHWLPTSYAGKRHAQVRAAVDIVSRSVPTMAGQSNEGAEPRLPAWTHLIYPAGVAGYGLYFVAGAGYLPGPRLALPGPLGQVPLSPVGLVVALVVLLPCLWTGLRKSARVLAARPVDAGHLALMVLAVWFIGHNLAYWLKLPTPGTASRYQVVNHVAWWLLAGAGAASLGPRWRRPALVALLVLALVNAWYWRGVYGSNCRHMQEVRLASAHYLATQLPPRAVVAAHDIGALGWAGQRRILDLGGLIDPAFLDYSKRGRLKDWLLKEGATHVVLPDKHSGESEGFFDYAKALGLDARHGIRLVPIAHFENSLADWRIGATPTWNALPGVTVYALLK